MRESGAQTVGGGLPYLRTATPAPVQTSTLADCHASRLFGPAECHTTDFEACRRPRLLPAPRLSLDKRVRETKTPRNAVVLVVSGRVSVVCIRRIDRILVCYYI